MEYSFVNIGLINGIDKQIEELQRKKEALQMGYCYIPGTIRYTTREVWINSNLTNSEKEKK